MFTGLVREIGTVRAVRRRRGVSVLELAAPASAPQLAVGDSLAVDGICLTVTAVRPPLVTVEAVAQTRRLTTLGAWRAGRRVHLEPAVRAGDPLGGHLVSGHVEGTARLVARRREGDALRLEFRAEPALLRRVPRQGSVAVDGVSLTVADRPGPDRFAVAVIPETQRATRLGGLRPGATVNLETDLLLRRDAAPADSGDAASGTGALTMERILSRGWGRGGTRGRAGGRGEG